VTKQRVLAILRRMTWIFAAGGAIYLWGRYDLIRLPGEGCSPLLSLRPESILWVDRNAREIRAGDVLFFSQANGSLGFGRVSKLKASPLGFWILADNPECSAKDSTDFGWVQASAIQARMVMAF
jgi:hypothetical protein